MEVELYIYDLSRGMARMYSMPLAGVQIDAIYHTSLVFGGVEYYFGSGIGRAVPGSTHHGRPMEVQKMGKTELPAEVIEEYIQSMESIYTPESYDLFMHNCNNFTQDLSMFLVGKSIPEKIKSLPQTVLNTPFGQMIKPQIEGMMRPITQAPVQSRAPAVPNGASNGLPTPRDTPKPSSSATQPPLGIVRNVTNTRELDSLLKSASKTCAVIFFTSATCPPCKICYPTYDELAAEAGDKATLIKVDLSEAYDIGARYQVRATPTFMTFLHGEKENEWSGANPAMLRGNVRMLIQMAHPVHPHRNLRLPSLQRSVAPYVTYKKVPPLEKLLDKIGAANKDAAIDAVVAHVKRREAAGAQEAALPDLAAFARAVIATLQKLPMESKFALVDLVRITVADTRVSGYFAAESQHKTLHALFDAAQDLSSCPYNLRIVMLQLACNLFTSPLSPHQILTDQALRDTAISLVSTCLLDTTRSNIRVTAASLAYNITMYFHNERFEGRPDPFDESSQVELVACLLESIQNETESIESLQGMLRALGHIAYETPVEGEVSDLCKAMGASEIVLEKTSVELFKREPLITEIGEELLGKGFK